MSTTCSTVLLFFFIILSTFPSISESMVQVKYSKEPISRIEGQPLTIKCTAEYDELACGSIFASWCLLDSSTACKPLIEPDRYLIHINETKIGGKRHRDTFFTFTPLTLRNTGLYQCTAKCQHTGTTAMGRAINVTVTDNPSKGQEIPNQSHRCTVNTFLLNVSGVILIWSYTIVPRA